MTPTSSSDTIRYLEAKKAIDDRSLNHYVWQALWRNMSEEPIRILELGAGIGTMIERLLERGQAHEAEYIAVDLNEDLLQEARSRLQAFSLGRGGRIEPFEAGLHLRDKDLDWRVIFQVADITAGLTDKVEGEFDLIIGNALLDLVDIPATLPELLGLLKLDGMYYFTITFDGLTHFGPPIDQELDRNIIQRYHQTMDERRYHGRSAGHSQSGRILLDELERLGAEIVAAGSSDWVIHPKKNGYPSHEFQFLNFILDTVESALEDQTDLSQEDLTRWLRQRRDQLARGKLIYLAHQLDVCGFGPDQASPG